ncbi:CDP-alcohol phosphatidyltransferase family protein [Sorangium sp. So ce1036]|uniref:CDP-alcohol phosphatidyltransferase family protein n=1 Tax=Sorangium sp. So ce1036 TaxID=3133328 RepID=UPI003F0A508E
MLGEAKRIYLATRKKHDQLFNTYFMRPLAGGVVALLARTSITPNQVTLLNLAIFVVAAALLIGLPTTAGGLVAIGVLELSYLFDCADGMLARHKQLASKEGHLFDFFTDELKAVLLSGALAVRFYRGGGLGLDGGLWAAGDPRFLLAGVVGVGVIASAISLTNFVRRPEISGKETSVSAYYETVSDERPRSPVARAAALVTTFLRFLNHYPSHIWAFALAGRLDVFFWIYVLINGLYLGRGWLGLLLRFGRS